MSTPSASTPSTSWVWLPRPPPANCPNRYSPRPLKDVAMAVASNGTTLVVTEKGDVYLLADYQCRKLASRQLNIRKVLVSRGSLDHRVDPQVLNEGGGENVAILALDEAGRVFCWRSVGGSVRQCRWAYGRQVFMSDIALSRNNMIFVTQEGEGFSGQWHGEYRKSGEERWQCGGVWLPRGWNCVRANPLGEAPLRPPCGQHHHGLQGTQLWSAAV